MELVAIDANCYKWRIVFMPSVVAATSSSFEMKLLISIRARCESTYLLVEYYMPANLLFVCLFLFFVCLFACFCHCQLDFLILTLANHNY